MLNTSRLTCLILGGASLFACSASPSDDGSADGSSGSGGMTSTPAGGAAGTGTGGSGPSDSTGAAPGSGGMDAVGGGAGAGTGGMGGGETCPDGQGGPVSTLCSDNTPEGACEDAIRLGPCDAHFFRSYDLDEYNPDITRAVIAVHGVGRDYNNQFSTVLRIARDAEREADVLVIAPLFPETPRIGEWAFNGYQTGGNGTCEGSTDRISAYAFTDALVEKLSSCENFPNLRDVVVIGHSGGGQHTGRYAAVTPVVERFARLRFKFVPTNPSTWAFLNDQRWANNQWTNDTDLILAEVNSQPFDTQCTSIGSYNRWGRGLDRITNSSYISGQELSADQIRNNWRSRNIVYFIGDEDNCDCGSMDSSCTARTQGPFRLQRAHSMYNNVTEFFPPFDGAVHELSEGPGCGHSSGCMYRSEPGRRHILE